MSGPVDISPNHLAMVLGILRKHLPADVRVWVFGSRADWTTKDSSDLDLALEGDSALDYGTIVALETAFEESKLPYKVDIIDLNQVSDSFRRIVGAQKILLTDADKLSGADHRWPSLKFGDCAELVGDTVSPAGPCDAPYVASEGMEGGALSPIGCGDAGDASSVKGRFRRGDILFDRLHPLSHKIARADFDGVCSADIWVVRPTAKTDADFLFYLMASKEFADAATRGSEGTKVSPARWEWISRHEVPMPPLGDQHSIACILRTLDDKIGLNRRTNQTLEGLARALFRSWFVDFDPVRAKTDGAWRRGESLPGLPAHLYAVFPDGMAESELGEIPEGWDLKPLDEMADFRNGLALQNHRPASGEPRLPVVTAAQLRNGQADGEEWAKGSIAPEYIIDDGDVIFSWSGNPLVKVWCGGRAALDRHLFKVIPFKYPKWFLLSWMEQHPKEFQGIAADGATTLERIQRHHLHAIKCIVPGENSLDAVNGMFESLLARQILNNIQSRSLVNLRDALLPKLISGNLRVPAATRRDRKWHDSTNPQ